MFYKMTDIDKEILRKESLRWKKHISIKLKEKNLDYILALSYIEKDFLKNMEFSSLARRGENGESHFIVLYGSDKIQIILKENIAVIGYYSYFEFGSRSRELMRDLLVEFGVEKMTRNIISREIREGSVWQIYKKRS